MKFHPNGDRSVLPETKHVNNKNSRSLRASRQPAPPPAPALPPLPPRQRLAPVPPPPIPPDCGEVVATMKKSEKMTDLWTLKSDHATNIRCACGLLALIGSSLECSRGNRVGDLGEQGNTSVALLCQMVENALAETQDAIEALEAAELARIFHRLSLGDTP